MRIVALPALLLLPLRSLAQDTSGQQECAKQYAYSADRSRFCYIDKHCDSVVICDFNTCSYYWRINSYFFLTRTEQDYEAGGDTINRETEYYYYHDSVVEDLYRRCPLQKYVISNSDFTTLIEGSGRSLETGNYKKYFKDTLVASGRFSRGNPTGFMTFYSYSLHPGKSIMYFMGNEHMHSHNFMEYGIPLYSIVIGLLAIVLAVVVIVTGWYKRLTVLYEMCSKYYSPHHTTIFYTLLSVNAIINVWLAATKSKTGPGNPLLLLFLLKMVNQDNALHALLGYFLLAASAVYIFRPGNRANTRAAAIVILIYNILLFVIRNAFAHSHFAFG